MSDATHRPHGYMETSDHEWEMVEEFEHPPDKAVLTFQYECHHCDAQKDETYERADTGIYEQGEQHG